MSDWSISDESGSDGGQSIVRRRTASVPDSPFGNFCRHVITNEILRPSEWHVPLSRDILQSRWDSMSIDDKVKWQARSDRKKCEFLVMNINEGLDVKTTLQLDADIESADRGGHLKPKHVADPQDRGQLASDRPVQDSEATVPRLMHRVEIYMLDIVGGKKQTALAEQIACVEHTELMDLKINKLESGIVGSSSTAFEVTDMVAQAGEAFKDRMVLNYLKMSNSIRYTGDGQLHARSEAGQVLTIKSQSIIEAVRSLAPEYPEFSFQEDKLVVAEPFCVFLHYREEMLALRDRLCSGRLDLTDQAQVDSDGIRSQQAGQISLLYDFVDSKFLEATQRERRRWNQSEPSCTFAWCWLLFSPGTVVYERKVDHGSLPQAYMVETFALGGLFHYDLPDQEPKVRAQWLEPKHGNSYERRLSRIKLTLISLTHDGRKWIPKRKTISLMPFDGDIPITNLKVYPREYADHEHDHIQDRLIARGERYHMLFTRGQYQYRGQVFSGARRWVDGRIMIDSDTLFHDSGLTVRHGGPRQPARGNFQQQDSYQLFNSDYDSDSKPSKRAVRQFTENKRRQRRDSFDSEITLPPYHPTDNSGETVNNDKDPLPETLEEITESSKKSLKDCTRDIGLEKYISDDMVYMICDQTIWGYVLDEQAWMLLAVENISQPEFQTGMINDLQVDEGTKRVIQALANKHTTQMATKDRSTTVNHETILWPAHGLWSSDFVPKKGQGQILLLHGKPGVGKTTAAECVAESTKRPLLSVACGDLGSNSSMLWPELSRWLRLGTLWNAVLLFDEADVFLEARRQGGDLHRNSLVSVFLRALEYYQGLVFLTTNRVGTFDEAVLSRIHVILHFPDLSNDDRQRIWDTSFKKLKNEREDVIIDDSVRDHALRDPIVRGLDWNGREIRNAFSNMIALAEWDAKETGSGLNGAKIEVRKEHLQQVAATSRSFKEYLRSLYGVGETSRAKQQGLRNDDFGKVDGLQPEFGPTRLVDL